MHPQTVFANVQLLNLVRVHISKYITQHFQNTVMGIESQFQLASSARFLPWAKRLAWCAGYSNVHLLILENRAGPVLTCWMLR